MTCEMEPSRLQRTETRQLEVGFQAYGVSFCSSLVSSDAAFSCSTSAQHPARIVQPVVYQPDYSQPQPPDYLALSIFSTFCCFWPLGIVAIMKSLEVRSAYRTGRLQDAVRASHDALMHNRLSILLGVIFLLAILVPGLMWVLPDLAL